MQVYLFTFLSGGGKNACYLLVEDEIGIREMTKKYLEKNGYEVKTANNGKEAIKIVSQSALDLILLDIEMPEMDGFETCQEIRKLATIPIIFLTVRRNTIDKIKCFELGG